MATSTMHGIAFRGWLLENVEAAAADQAMGAPHHD
jgi:hypothetical protein